MAEPTATQAERVLAVLARGPAFPMDIVRATGIAFDNVNAVLSKLKKEGLVARPGGKGTQWQRTPVQEDGGAEPEMPSAHEVALAVVAACGVTGDDPVFERENWMRCRVPAAKALSVFYPECPVEAIGRFVGLPKLTLGTMHAVETAPWWAEIGDLAFEGAVTALERA